MASARVRGETISAADIKILLEDGTISEDELADALNEVHLMQAGESLRSVGHRALRARKKLAMHRARRHARR